MATSKSPTTVRYRRTPGLTCIPRASQKDADSDAIRPFGKPILINLLTRLVGLELSVLGELAFDLLPDGRPDRSRDIHVQDVGQAQHPGSELPELFFQAGAVLAPPDRLGQLAEFLQRSRPGPGRPPAARKCLTPRAAGHTGQAAPSRPLATRPAQRHRHCGPGHPPEGPHRQPGYRSWKSSSRYSIPSDGMASARSPSTTSPATRAS